MLYNLNLIAKWFEETGILAASTPSKQFIKLPEELGEIGEEISTGFYDKEALAKEIGDYIVVLTGVCLLTGCPLSIIEMNGCKFKSVDGAFICLTVKTGLLAAAIAKDKTAMDALMDCGWAIDGLCKTLDIDKNECARLAYKKIEKRTGKMVNGVFIKTDDLKETK